MSRARGANTPPMRAKRILCRILFWAMVAVAHLVASEPLACLVQEVAFEWKAIWLSDVVDFLLFAPGSVLREYGLRPLGLFPKKSPALDALPWAVLVAGVITGARWLWAIRPGRLWSPLPS